MPLVDLWESVKSEFGDGVPHEIKELELVLPEGDVAFEVRYSKTEYSDSRVEVRLSDSDEYATILGRTGDEVFYTATDPFFFVSPTSERLYFSRDKEIMKDFMTARSSYDVQLESLKVKFDKDRVKAAADLKSAEVKREELIAVLDKVEASWYTGGRWNQKKTSLHWEKIHAEEDKITVANAVLRQTSPPKIDNSYIRAIRFCGLDVLDLSKIVGAVKSTRAELMGTLGVLPKKVTVIPVLPMLNLLVTWND